MYLSGLNLNKQPLRNYYADASNFFFCQLTHVFYSYNNWWFQLCRHLFEKIKEPHFFWSTYYTELASISELITLELIQFLLLHRHLHQSSCPVILPSSNFVLHSISSSNVPRNFPETGKGSVWSRPETNLNGPDLLLAIQQRYKLASNVCLHWPDLKFWQS